MLSWKTSIKSATMTHQNIWSSQLKHHHPQLSLWRLKVSCRIALTCRWMKMWRPSPLFTTTQRTKNKKTPNLLITSRSSSSSCSKPVEDRNHSSSRRNQPISFSNRKISPFSQWFRFKARRESLVRLRLKSYRVATSLFRRMPHSS